MTNISSPLPLPEHITNFGDALPNLAEVGVRATELGPQASGRKWAWAFDIPQPGDSEALMVRATAFSGLPGVSEMTALRAAIPGTQFTDKEAGVGAVLERKVLELNSGITFVKLCSMRDSANKPVFGVGLELAHEDGPRAFMRGVLRFMHGYTLARESAEGIFSDQVFGWKGFPKD